MNWGMWIGIIGGGIGALVGLGSAVIFGGLPGIIMAVVFIIVFGAIFYPLLIKPMMTASRLRKVGVPATAKVLEMHDTGVTLNNSPQVKLMLEVSSPTGSYVVETKQYISRLQTSMFQPGSMLPVLIDPNDRNMISLDYDGQGASQGGYGASAYSSGVGASGFNNPDKILTGPWTGIGRQEAERRLVDFDAKNKQISAYGTSARAIVTRYTWLGMYVNGDNPAVEIEVQVLPTDRPAFQAITYGVIMEQSVPKFQPGEEIFVKFDPNDTTKVTIEHS